MRFAIYARHSSDLQNPKSIEDQASACTARIIRESGSLVRVCDGTMDAVIDQNPPVEAREVLNILNQAKRGLPYEYHSPRLQVIFKENIPKIRDCGEYISNLVAEKVSGCRIGFCSHSALASPLVLITAAVAGLPE